MIMLSSYVHNAEYMIQHAEHYLRSQKHHINFSSKWRSIHSQLHDTSIEETEEEDGDNLTTKPAKRLHMITNPLRKLCVKDKNLNRLVVNLFPADNGYTLMLKHGNGQFVETIQLPYDEYEILEYIDNEQIPPLLVQILDDTQVNMFYSGCIITEIRDYRIAATANDFELRYVLLWPTQQTLLEDVNGITTETSHLYRWGNDDALALESYLVLATAEPLCLDPSPTVQVVKNMLDDRKRIFKTQPIKRCIRRNGVNAIRRRKKRRKHCAPEPLKLFDFLQKRKAQQEEQQAPSNDIRLPKNVVDLWRKTPLELSYPTNGIDVIKYAKLLTPHPKSIEDSDLLKVQQVHLKSEGPNRDIYSLITILQRPSDMHYFGKLQSNKYFQQSPESLQDVSNSCRFSLGTEHRANLYIQQYQELFAEDGRRPATITVKRSTQQPHKYQIPLLHQPWQLEQDKSLYSVGSVNNIPVEHWPQLRIADGASKPRLGPTLTQVGSQVQRGLAASANQIPVSANNPPITSTTTPTLNAVTLRSSSQSAFMFPTHRQAGQLNGASTPSPHPLQNPGAGSSGRVLGQRLSSDSINMLSTSADSGVYQLQENVQLGRLSRQNSSQDVFTFDSPSGVTVVSANRTDSSSGVFSEANCVSNSALLGNIDSASNTMKQGNSFNLHMPIKKTLSGQQQMRHASAMHAITIGNNAREQQQTSQSSQSTNSNSVTLRMPVKFTNSRNHQVHQRTAQTTPNQHLNVHQQQTPGTVIRMPVSISNTISGQQITAAINLLGNSGRNVLTPQSSILGNIQLPSGLRLQGGTVTIPASELQSNLSMQLSSDHGQSNQDNGNSSISAAPQQQFTVAPPLNSSSEPVTIITNKNTDGDKQSHDQQFRTLTSSRPSQQFVQVNDQQNKSATITYNPRTHVLTANVGGTGHPVQLLHVNSNTLQQLPIRMTGQQVMLNTARQSTADQANSSQFSQMPLSQQLQLSAHSTVSSNSSVKRGRKRKATLDQTK